MLRSLHVLSPGQAGAERSVSHLVFQRLFLRTCTSESSGEFKVVLKRDNFCSSSSIGVTFPSLQYYFIKDISETYLANPSHCYGIFFSLLCSYFTVVALISCFSPLSVPHISRKQAIHYGGDQIREKQQYLRPCTWSRGAIDGILHAELIKCLSLEVLKFVVSDFYSIVSH